MRVAQMIDTLSWGGAQKLIVSFAQVAKRRGLPVAVINLRKEDDAPHPGELRATGARVITVPAPTLLNPKRLWTLIQLFRREQFDVVQTHLTYANILGPLVGRLTGTPVVATLHSIGVDPRHYHPTREGLEALALRHGARRVIAVGHAVAETHRHRLGRTPLEIIPNAVDTIAPLPPAERESIRAQMAADSSQTILISVGRLSPPKGYNDLLAAFARIHARHPRTALVIIGDGALRDDLTSNIAALKLEGKAILLGARTDVPKLLAASDLYIASSHWEGLPLTILEAMSAALPIVATDVGDVKRVVMPGTGLVVPPHNPEALAEAAHSLLSDPNRLRAWGAAAQSHVARHYNFDLWFDNLARVYSQIGNHAPRPAPEAA